MASHSFKVCVIIAKKNNACDFEGEFKYTMAYTLQCCCIIIINPHRLRFLLQWKGDVRKTHNKFQEEKTESKKM